MQGKVTGLLVRICERISLRFGVRLVVTHLAGNLAGGDLAAGDLPDGPLYVHVDLDVIDPAGVPGLRYPAPGGPTPGQVGDAVRHLLDSGRVAAVGIACTWHPGHGAAAGVAPYLRAALASGG